MEKPGETCEQAFFEAEGRAFVIERTGSREVLAARALEWEGILGSFAVF